MSQDRLLEVADQLRRRLVPGDLDATLQAITSAAVDLLPDVDFASITVNQRRGPIRAVAPTDPMIVDLDRGQYDCQEGPCYEAATESVHVVSSDLAAERRWPCYAPIALAAGVNAQAGIRLFENRGTLGALNLYSTRPGAFADLAPIGALGRIRDGVLHLSAVVLTADGTQRLAAADNGSPDDPESLGRRVAEKLLEQGAAELIDEGRSNLSS